MSAGLWIAMEAKNQEQKLHNKIKSLKMILSKEAHCNRCKFSTPFSCGGLINKNTLKSPTDSEKVYCSDFILEDAKRFSNKDLKF